MEIRDTLPTLRASLDINDTFAAGGHQIMKTAGATRHADRMKRVPVWALDDEKIKELVRLRFPKAGSDPRQRKLASRMVRLIHLYYRVGATTDAVAEEFKITRNAVKLRLRKLNRTMRTLRPSHRPKKKVDPIETERGSSGEGRITL